MVPPCAAGGCASRPCSCPIWGRSGRQPHGRRSGGSWLIIINILGLFADGDSFILPVPHATFFSIHCQRVPARRVGRFRRQPRLHHRQPGRRLRRRPVPRQGREMRRPCRPLLLPVTGICAGHRLPPRRSRRDHRLGSEAGGRQMYRQRLRRIRRHHLPALNSRHAGISGAGLPHLRPGNDVTLPREAAIGCGLGRSMPPWPRHSAVEPRGSLSMAGYA